MNISDSDCRTDEGITIGLIDGVIAICRVLRKRDLSSPNIQEALLDMSGDEDIAFVLAAYNQVDSHTKRSSDMSIRIRTVNGMRVALCAAETDPAPGDIYLDDADHYALAAKFMRDWQESGLMEKSVEGWAEWPVMDSQKVRDAKTELEQWQSAHAGKGLTLSVPLDDEDNGRFMAPLEIGKQDMPKLVSDTPLYDWNDPRIPEDSEWLATNSNGETRAFKTEPTKDHMYKQMRDTWGVMCITETTVTGSRYGYFDEGVHVFDSPGPLVDYVEKRPSKAPIYNWNDPCIPDTAEWLATNIEGDTRAFVVEPTNTDKDGRNVRFNVYRAEEGKPETFCHDLGVLVFYATEAPKLWGKKEKRPSSRPRPLSIKEVIGDNLDVTDVILEFIDQTGVTLSIFNWADPRIPQGCQYLATSDDRWTKSFGRQPKLTSDGNWFAFGEDGSISPGHRVFADDVLPAGFSERRPFTAPSYYWDHPYVQHWLRLNQVKIKKRGAKQAPHQTENE